MSLRPTWQTVVDCMVIYELSCPNQNVLQHDTVSGHYTFPSHAVLCAHKYAVTVTRLLMAEHAFGGTLGNVTYHSNGFQRSLQVILNVGCKVLSMVSNGLAVKAHTPHLQAKPARGAKSGIGVQCQLKALCS